MLVLLPLVFSTQADDKVEGLARRVTEMEDAVRREVDNAVRQLSTRVSSEASNSASSLEESERGLRRQLEEAQRRAQEATEQAQARVRPRRD